MRKEIEKGYVLKFSLAIIVIVIGVMIAKFNSNKMEEIKVQKEMDSIDAYMKNWYENIDTNGNGIPDLDESNNIQRYDGFYDVPAGADSIIIVKGKLYGMNDDKTKWIRLKK
tara:strand:+ start:201 stop:536 length:336 start_codon:yes stop_codon:yes gene_type:complete